MTARDRAILEAIRKAIRAETAPTIAKLDRVIARLDKPVPA